jgi:hypothetical protein
MTMKNTLVSIVSVGLVVAELVACSASDAPSDATATSSSTAATTSASTVTSTASGAGGAGGGVPDCFTSPMTHLEIINGCTDAEAVDKVVNLPLLNGDGTLPPLP